MKLSYAKLLLTGLLAACVAAGQEKTTQAEPEVPRGTAAAVTAEQAPTAVPRLIKFSGAFKDRVGRPLSGVVGVAFALYKEREGGLPVWLELQNVELDEQGRYAALLGAATPEGMPLDLFTSGEPRWLGVQVQIPGQEEQPRALLVSVPYALKAADAETLGGRPLSAFVLAQPPGSAEPGGLTPPASKDTAGVPRNNVTIPTAAATTSNYLAKYSTDNDLEPSLVYETFSGNIGIGTLGLGSKLGVVGTTILAVPSTQTTATYYPNLSLFDNRTRTVGNSQAIIFQNSGTEHHARIEVTDLGGGGNANARLDFKVNSAAEGTDPGTRLSIVGSTGNVGIGTAGPPATKLEVDGDTTLLVPSTIATATTDYVLRLFDNRSRTVNNAQAITFQNAGAEHLARIEVTDLGGGGNAAARMDFKVNSAAEGTNPSSRLTILNSGNVGIGTTPLTEKLEVAGNVKLTGTGNGIIFPDGTKQTTACGALAFGAPSPAESLFRPAVAWSAPGGFASGGASGELGYQRDIDPAIAALRETVRQQQALIEGLQAQVEALKATLSAISAERLVSQRN